MAISSTSFKKGHKVNKGRPSHWRGKKLPYAVWNKDKPTPEETKKKQRLARIGRFGGEKHWNWQGGITELNSKIRTCDEYKLWRKSVFERDRWTCIWCGYRSHTKIKGRADIQADHIKPFALFPELRFAIDNGRTLCVPCHKKTGTWGKVDRLQTN